MLATLILNILTAKVLPVLIPPLVKAVRTYVITKVPPQFIPPLLAVGGALFDTVATWLGVEGMPADTAMLTSAAWEGALIGLAATGLHQCWRQAREWYRNFKTKRAAAKKAG